MQFPTIHFHPTSSKYALIKRYEFLYYRSFWKVNKNTFWVKASYMNMEDPIEMKLKGLFRGHPKLSKKSKNTSLGLKFREICIVKVDQFLEMCMKSTLIKMSFFPNGPMFSCLKLVPKMAQDPWAYPPIILLFLLFILIFYPFKSK